jgi:hypothetical protein
MDQRCGSDTPFDEPSRRVKPIPVAMPDRLCHYCLDGRIWTRRAHLLAA